MKVVPKSFLNVYIGWTCIQHVSSFGSPFANNVASLKSKKNVAKKIGGKQKNVPVKEKVPFSIQSFGISKPSVKNAKLKEAPKKSNKGKPKDSVVKKNSAFSIQSFGISKPSLKQVDRKDVPKKNGNKVLKKAAKPAPSKGIKVPDIKVEVPKFSVDVPSPVGIAGSGMQLLKPLFKAEAQIQAGVLVNIVDIIGAPFRVYPDEIRAELKKRISSIKPVLYTYPLSPFSAEAKKILKEYDVEEIQVGPEWFLLGPEKSELRLALAENTETYQTSLPHLFVKGESLGGLSTGGRDNAGINGLKKSGELDKLLKKKKN